MHFDSCNSSVARETVTSLAPVQLRADVKRGNADRERRSLNSERNREWMMAPENKEKEEQEEKWKWRDVPAAPAERAPR